jgi:hypothetical protein
MPGTRGLAAGPDGLLLTPSAACAHWLVGRERIPAKIVSDPDRHFQHPPVFGYEFATRTRRNRPRIRTLGSRLAAPVARICSSEACAGRPPPRLPCRRSRVRVPSAASVKRPANAPILRPPRSSQARRGRLFSCRVAIGGRTPWPTYASRASARVHPGTLSRASRDPGPVSSTSDRRPS